MAVLRMLYTVSQIKLIWFKFEKKPKERWANNPENGPSL